MRLLSVLDFTASYHCLIFATYIRFHPRFGAQSMAKGASMGTPGESEHSSNVSADHQSPHPQGYDLPRWAASLIYIPQILPQPRRPRAHRHTCRCQKVAGVMYPQSRIVHHIQICSLFLLGVGPVVAGDVITAGLGDLVTITFPVVA